MQVLGINEPQKKVKYPLLTMVITVFVILINWSCQSTSTEPSIILVEIRNYSVDSVNIDLINNEMTQPFELYAGPTLIQNQPVIIQFNIPQGVYHWEAYHFPGVSAAFIDSGTVSIKSSKYVKINGWPGISDWSCEWFNSN